MKQIKRIVSLSAVAAFGASIAIPAQAQFLGLFQGVISATNQVTSKVGKSIMGADKPVNLEEERNKFYGSTEAQMAGMDEATKRIMRTKLQSSWQMVEQSFLVRNAEAYKSKMGPLIDLKQIAASALGGLAVQANIGAIGASTGLTGVLSGATMDGILAGVGAQSTSFNPNAARVLTTPYGNNVSTAVGAAASNTISSIVSTAISTSTQKILADSQVAADMKTYDINELNHPLVFFDKHPSELSLKDLYRENGNLGWKKIDSAATAEAYAPVVGDEMSTAAVFNFDADSKIINAAFRILKASQMDFISIVQGVSKTLQAQPRYASQGDVLRAVWQNGAFVTADPTKVTVGWSHLVPQTFQASAPVQTQAMSDLAK
jgi:hypothetical protein